MADDQRSDSRLDPGAGDDDYGDTLVKDPESNNQGTNNAEKASSGNSTLDRAQGARDSYRDVKNLLGKKNQPDSGPSQPHPQNQGHFPGNQLGQGANKTGKAEQAGANAGRAGGAPTGQGAAGGKGSGPAIQQAGQNAGSSGTKTAGQTAAKAGQKTAQQAQQAGKAAAKVADSASDDQEAKLAGKAAGKAIGAGVGAATGDRELGRKVGEGVGDATRGGVALGETIASAGADVEADKELAKLAWKYKGIVFKAWGIIFILIFAFFFILLNDDAGWANDQTTPEQSALSITQSGPTTAKNGDLLSYTITLSYPDPFEDIKLTNNIPNGTQFVSSLNKVTCNNGDCNELSKTVYWSAKENNITTNPVNASFKLTLKAVNVPNKSKLSNIVTGTVIPPASTTTSTITPAPQVQTGTGPKTP